MKREGGGLGGLLLPDFRKEKKEKDKGTFFADALNLESLIALKEAIEIVIKVLEDTYY